MRRGFMGKHEVNERGEGTGKERETGREYICDKKKNTYMTRNFMTKILIKNSELCQKKKVGTNI